MALLLARSVAMAGYVEKHQQEVRDFISIAQDVPAGDRLFFVWMDRRVSDVRQWHLSAYAIPFARVFVLTLFQGVHAFSVKDQWKEYSAASAASILYRFLLDESLMADLPSGMEMLRDWHAKYTHLAVMGSARNGFDDLVLHPALELIEEKGRFRLYRIVPPPVASE